MFFVQCYFYLQFNCATSRREQCHYATLSNIFLQNRPQTNRYPISCAANLKPASPRRSYRKLRYFSLLRLSTLFPLRLLCTVPLYSPLFDLKIGMPVRCVLENIFNKLELLTTSHCRDGCRHRTGRRLTNTCRPTVRDLNERAS